MMIPPITFGIPLATVLYQSHLGGNMSGVILANLVPTVPFVVLVMIPFIEQIDPRIEAAARVFGAGTGRLFLHVLLPLLAPGILAALLLVLVRTIAMFELTFFTAGPGQPDAGGGALLCGLCRRRPGRAVDRRDGGRLHGHDTGLAADRVALRRSDPDRHAGQARGGRLTAAATTDLQCAAVANVKVEDSMTIPQPIAKKEKPALKTRHRTNPPYSQEGDGVSGCRG